MPKRDPGRHFGSITGMTNAECVAARHGTETLIGLDDYYAIERATVEKEYAKKRYAEIDWKRNPPATKPGDPYPFQGGKTPYLDLLNAWPPSPPRLPRSRPRRGSRSPARSTSS